MLSHLKMSPHMNNLCWFVIKIGFEDIIVLFLASKSRHYVLDFVRDVLQLVYFQEGFVLKFVDLEIKTEKELNFPSKEIHKNI